jgi:uncharacterized protein YgiM (DUF1202 family)
MKGFLLGLSKLVLGLVIALLLLSMAGIATARYFMSRLSVLPPKPLYGEEQPVVAAIPSVEPPPEVTAEVIPEAAPAEAPPAEVAPPVDPELPAGSYQAVVIQPIGLILREGPGTEHPQVGGIDYNEALVVLEEPTDQGWIKVRVTSSGQEGWVKAGNTRRAE